MAWNNGKCEDCSNLTDKTYRAKKAKQSSPTTPDTLTGDYYPVTTELPVLP